MVTFKGANLITVTFQTKPHWPPGHRELAFLRTFNFHATTGAVVLRAPCLCLQGQAQGAGVYIWLVGLDRPCSKKARFT